jgi:probable HAF family extracellular repeat protein
MTSLGTLPGKDSSVAERVSHDGSVIVGTSGNQAFRWTKSGGIVGIGDLPGGISESTATGVSGDGSVVVGRSASANGREAYRWTEADGFLALGDLPGAPFVGSQAFAISSDGNVIIGEARGQSRGFRWTQADGMIDLGILTAPRALSSDGQVIVGSGDSEALLWTAANGVVRLGDLAGGGFASQAVAISGDGSIVVGRGTTALGNEAMIWDATSGMRELDEVLISLGMDLTRWSLTWASGISDDGLTIVGIGTNPSGDNEGWIAVIPEPTTAFLLAAGLAGLAAARRRRRL